ncbi:carbohydrate ABC transporter permease [Dactylosporangium sp. CA-233914]|uniref:carbohydrate ABC transporter permease n=1 Tax=Dactylosporangium sp. CA-233914 TaxID=3239934 RepID=UPI003D92A654
MTRVVVTVLKYVGLVIASVLILLPLVTLLFAAFKTKAEYSTTSAFTPPRDWFNFQNFRIAFVEGQMLSGILNTGIIMLVSLAGTTFLGTFVAYAVDRFALRGRRIVLGGFLLAALIPSVTTQVATFQIINALGIFDTRGAAILLFIGTDVVAVYIFLQFMAAIPKTLDEAARVDGAGHFRIYWRIILPLLRPAIATTLIIKGIAIYNEFYIPFLYMPSPELSTISTSLYHFKGPFGADWQIIAAGTIIVILPSLMLFAALQRFIYRGLTAGAVR